MLDIVADFETTTDPEDCRVWGWGLAYVTHPEHVEIDRDIDSFIDRVSFEDARCYFHNLKFDGFFILFWLLTHGYVHIDSDVRLQNGTFKTLIDGMGKFYTIEVGWKMGTRTQFRDSLKKLPFSVAEVAETFGMPESKGDIDYHKHRPVGYIMTDEERDYIRRDVSIVAHAMRQTLDEGMKRLTVGSDALAEYKKLQGKKFTRTFPVLSEHMDAEIRRAYRGGFTYADPRFKGRKLGGGVVLDVNSLYPYIMYDRELPYGEPKWQDGKVTTSKQYPLSVFSVTFTATLKPDHIPVIQVKGSSRFMPTDYVSVVDEPTTLMVTNVDWALYNAHYDVQVLEYGGGWLFKSRKGMFNDYIDKWMEIKASTSGGRRALAKLFLNSLYGKFASNPTVTTKVPELEDGKVKLKSAPDETRDPVYTPVGVFITSWARAYTITAAQENYDVFAYCDTDSLHLMAETIPESIRVDPHALGAWKHEYNFTEAFYVRAKAYMERKEDGELETHIAGVPKKVADELTFEHMKDGQELHGKMVPKSVPGGVVLKDVPYVLKM